MTVVSLIDGRELHTDEPAHTLFVRCLDARRTTGWLKVNDRDVPADQVASVLPDSLADRKAAA